MTGKSEAANLACASVEDMEENPFPLLHPNRLAMTKHPSIDGEQGIADLVALWPSSGERGLHCAFAGILQTSYCSCGREEVHIHVSTLAEGRVKFLQRQEDFTVVVARIASWFDIHRPDESTVLPSAEVASSTDMRVIEAKAKGLWNERNSAASMRSDERRPFFCRTVYIRRDSLSMPVKLLWNVGLIMYIDRDTLAFFEAEKRTRKLAVVGSYRHDVLWSQFDWLGRDGQGVVGRRLGLNEQ